MLRSIPFVAALFLLLFAAPARVFADVLHVDADAAGPGNGTSWADAFPDLQAALAMAAPLDEVWVAAGTYHPGLPGDRPASFQLASGVSIYGGFAGTEAMLSERDVTANVTILSGDLDDDDTYGAGANWWQFNWTGSGNNSFHVVTGTGADASAVLDGVTIRSGIGADPAILAGGGLLVLGGSPALRGVTFQYNALGYGSSAYLSDCNSVFEDCVVRDAYACNCGSGGWVSGILCTGASDVTFTDCDFVNHYYVSSQSQGRGAALTIDFSARATLVGCRFIGNQTGNFYPMGGGTAYGAGCNALGDVIVDRCEFVDNFAHAGAGLAIWGDAVVTNSLFARNEAVPHPNGSGFEDGDYGAGLLTLGSGVVEIANCTFVDNNCEKGAGLAILGVGGTTLRNSIVYGNYADPPLPGEDTVWILKQNLTGNYDVANSCVEGLLQTEPGEDPPEPDNFPGCLDTAPLLADVAGEDYRLAAGSPCIDAGDNMAVPPGLAVDLAGAPRFADDPTTPDTGVGPAPIVDMGALEFSAVVDPWSDLGGGSVGSSGQPTLVVSGPLTAGSDLVLELSQAPANALMLFRVSLASTPLDVVGGTLHAHPFALQLLLSADAAGGFGLTSPVAPGVPAGQGIWFQFIVQDLSVSHQITLSNAMTAVTP
jgi:hypothetical protein